MIAAAARTIALAIAVAAAGGCKGGAGDGASGGAGGAGGAREASAAVAPVIDAAPPDARRPDARPRDPRPSQAKTSTRCAECHGKMADEWRATPHARSGTSKLYGALVAGADDPDACAGCHTPLVPLVGADVPAAREGVTCDVCHTIARVEIDAPPPRFAPAIYDMVKYGPLCDAKDHYFHRMGCSKLHASAELCGACHQRVVDGPSGPVPLYTTYQEWKESAYPDEGWVCQDCHMPGVRAVVAEGEKPRDEVPDHGFFGGGDLRKDSIKVELAARALDGAKTFEARLTSYAGHDLPTGFPGKRVVLRAVALDRKGLALAKDEQAWGRRLVDGRGAPTAYAGAVRVASDDRLRPKEVRTVPLFGGQAIGGAARIEVQLVWQSIDPALAAPLGVATDERPIARAALKVKP